MRNGGGLPRGKCSELRGAGDLACSGIRREGRSARITHLHLAANPSARRLYRPTGSTVVRSDLLEVMKHMLCAVGRPRAKSWWSLSDKVPPRRTVMSRGSRFAGRITRATQASDKMVCFRKFIVSRAVSFRFRLCDA